MRPASLLVLLLLVAPASAGWVDHGQREPGPRDLADRMWSDASAAGGRVYFNAFATSWPSAASTSFAVLDAEAEAIPPIMRWEAMLGLWHDCNGDGYVGHAAGLPAYPPALLDPAGAAACPEGGPHRVNGLVVELRPIGMIDPCAYEPDAVREDECRGMPAFSPNPIVLYANGTYVWGDLLNKYRLPTCATWPIPPGTTARTGALVAYMDCRMNGKPVAAVNGVDQDGTLGLRFDGPPQRSNSTLNRDLPAHPYHNPYTGQAGLIQYGSGRPAFTVWDCASGEPAPAPRVRDPTASWWDALDAASDGATAGCAGSSAGPFDYLGPDLQLERTGWYATPMTSWASRDHTDITFRFDDGSRAVGPSPPGGTVGGARWTLNSIWLTTHLPFDRNQLGLRNDLDWTFYARVNVSAAGLPSEVLPAGGATFRYGGEVCPDDSWTWTSWHPVWGIWNCDPDAWWQTWTSQDRMPRYERGEPLGQRVGDPYHLRDWDCQETTGVRVADPWGVGIPQEPCG